MASSDSEDQEFLRRLREKMGTNEHGSIEIAFDEERGFFDDSGQLSPRSMQRLEEEAEKVELEESMWDASVFLGARLRGTRSGRRFTRRGTAPFCASTRVEEGFRSVTFENETIQVLTSPEEPRPPTSSCCFS